ncbi:arginine--tRNA ligase [Sphaerisporangium rufum]|uniref:Arginine--tRNA ligase n=1 Tax=Sphaerisporangium rufum TaxID=1381558 RepID=A0A919QXN6_9ACTN|nr:arginine--tRNA ligase [Sphaerisporangium rufum]GII75872.1 arginine--tRNA ligase [Sphaerisporangium rufum]
MAPVVPLAVQTRSRLVSAMDRALPAEHTGADPQVRRSDRADLQANGLLAIAGKLRTHPRAVAEKVVASLDGADLIASCEVSGPGFVNLTLADSALLGQVEARLADDRLGIPRSLAGTTVIDYSQPNIAKEMHVGHLRSTIIGDSIARILGFLGEDVIRQNHLGDWGTQFGMLIQHLAESGGEWRRENGSAAGSLSRLNRLYQDSRARFDSDEEFAERARGRVVALQAGDAGTLRSWQEIVAESKLYFDEVYERLGVLLTDDDAVGESFYNPFLAEVADELEKAGVAVNSDGALCVFFEDIAGQSGEPLPLIIRKRDGGFGYAATDLAAIRHRVGTLAARRILYVVDVRQALHFRMVFETARRIGWLPGEVDAVHLAFGTVLGKDGKPFKTRSGRTVRLISLLDEAVDRARLVVKEKSHDLAPGGLDTTATVVGIGAVKYADLATSRAKDYVFDVDRMVSLHGNTGVYLQYAHARTRSILRKAGSPLTARARVHRDLALEPAERALALKLDDFEPALTEVAHTYEPHRLCVYLFELAQSFTSFFETCPVLKAPDPEIRDNRLMLCRLTGDTLRIGLGLLGLAAPDRL